MHDLVIRGGSVVDGSGRPARTADVAIDDGRITEVSICVLAVYEPKLLENSDGYVYPPPQ